MAAIAYAVDQSKTAGVSAGPTTFTIDIPTGKRLGAIALSTAANNKAVTITTVKPFVNKAQTVVGAALFMTAASTSVPLTTQSLAITSTTRGELYCVYAHKPSLSSGNPFGALSAYGFQVTVTCTAAGGSGNWYFNAVVEG